MDHRKQERGIPRRIPESARTRLLSIATTAGAVVGIAVSGALATASDEPAASQGTQGESSKPPVLERGSNEIFPEQLAGELFSTVEPNWGGVEEEQGGDFEASRSGTTTEIAAEPEDGVAVDTAGGEMTLTPLQADADSKLGESSPSGAGVIYSDAQNGSDYAVVPRPDGFETFSTIPDENSPTTFRFEISLPGDERLEMTDEGGVQIVDPTPGLTSEDLSDRPSAPALDPDEIPAQIEAGEIRPNAAAPDPGAEAHARDLAGDGGMRQAPPPGDVADLPPAPMISENSPSGGESPKPLQPGPGGGFDPDSANPPPAPSEGEIAAFNAGIEEDLGPDAATDPDDEIESLEAEKAERNADLRDEEVKDELARLNREVVVAGIRPPVSVDANDADMPTEFSIEGNTLTMTVDTEGAAYPIVADPYVVVYQPRTAWYCCDPVYGWEYRFSHWSANWNYYGSWYTAYMIWYAGSQGWYVDELSEYGWPGWYEIYWFGQYLTVTPAEVGPIYWLDWYQVYTWQYVVTGYQQYPVTEYDPIQTWDDVDRYSTEYRAWDGNCRLNPPEPCVPDDFHHGYCWGNDFDNGNLRDAAHYGMQNLDNQTQYNRDHKGSCRDGTDIVFRRFNWEGTRGAYSCVERTGSGTCSRAQIQLNPALLTNDLNRRKTACHEVGHSGVLKHSWEATDCMVRGEVNSGHQNYSGAHVNTLNNRG